MPLFRRIGLYGGLGAILATLIFPFGVAHAQTATAQRPPLDLMTSPLPLNVTTRPGVPVTADIRVKNNGPQPEQLKVELLKFGANGESGQPKIEDRGPNDIYFNWVHFSETNFDAEPNVWKTIHMTISPPKEAAFGYYYAVLFSRANPNHGSNGQSAVEGGVASLVLLSVDAPGSRREAQVVSLTATHKVYEFLPAEFDVKLHNSGNLHVAPTGTMFVKRGGTQVASIDFNAERGNILPGTDRVFSLNWNDGFPSYKETKVGDKTVNKLTWDFGKVQKLRFGRYTAQLVAVYDDGQRDVPIEAVVSFWVIPWRILGIILLFVLFIGGGIWAFMRVIWRNIKRQALADVPTPPAAPAATQEAETVTVEPAPADNTLAAALGKRKKRSWFRKKTAEPAEQTPPVTEPEQPLSTPGRRQDRGKNHGRKKNKQAAAQIAPARKPAKQAPAAELAPPAQEAVKQPNPQAWAQSPKSSRNGQRKNHRKNKHKRRYG